jgi:hypothetical protein
MLSKINWLEKLGELSIIVLGILVAFSLDSCWESWTDSSREQAYLVQLKKDFEETRDRLDEALKQEKSINENIRQGLELFKTPPSDENANALAEILPGMLTFPRFAPVSGTYGSLFYSGDIRLLQNDDLRRHLVSFAGSWELAHDELLRLGNWVYQTLSSPVAQEFMLAELQVTQPGQRQALLNKTKEQVDFVDLLADKRFSNFVTDLWMGSNKRIVSYEYLMEEMKKVTDELADVKDE